MECLRHCLPSLITLSGVCLLEVIFGSRKASVLQVGGTAEGVSRVEPLPQLITPLVSLKSWLPGPSLGRRPSEGSSSSRGLWVGLESWLRGPQTLPHGDAGHTPPQPQAPTGSVKHRWDGPKEAVRERNTDAFPSHECHRSVMFGSHLKLGMSETEPPSACPASPFPLDSRAALGGLGIFWIPSDSHSRLIATRAASP